jgi:hypothetical protein
MSEKAARKEFRNQNFLISNNNCRFNVFGYDSATQKRNDPCIESSNKKKICTHKDCPILKHERKARKELKKRLVSIEANYTAKKIKDMLPGGYRVE